MEKKHAFTVRLNNSEFSEMKKKIKEAGISQQALISRSLRNARISSSEELAVLKDISLTFSTLVQQLRGMATNVNQMARIGNTYNCLPQVDELQKTARLLSDYRKESEELWLSIRSLINPRKVTQD